MTKEKKNLGKIGEDLAVSFLKKNGYKIVERNFLTRIGEIDIIAKDKKVICFIEVKTRKSLDFGVGYEAVLVSKQGKIINAAKIYLAKNNICDTDIRFDVLSILLSDDNEIKEIEVIKGAFDSD
ncbi:MAG: YraN family protein [Candidatus Zapsychrus exili]|nr:YraN family protein [Candidatus Zapsychrus exili]